MIIFVGRRTHASAANKRHFRRLNSATVRNMMVNMSPSSPGHLYLDCRLALSRVSSSSSSSSLSSSSSGSTSSLSRNHSHGQKYRATMVNVVSAEFENVRVEQNHCQGLRTVNASYRQGRLLAVLSRVGAAQIHTVAHAS